MCLPNSGWHAWEFLVQSLNTMEVINLAKVGQVGFTGSFASLSKLNKLAIRGLNIQWQDLSHPCSQVSVQRFENGGVTALVKPGVASTLLPVSVRKWKMESKITRKSGIKSHDRKTYIASKNSFNLNTDYLLFISPDLAEVKRFCSARWVSYQATIAVSVNTIIH
ncbi:hypothetical protein FGSG_02889 [Fusarium graminearum PH-1]|uniref:Chromosome 2, complete genome n=1 Tax=Gibberella zeae (strain ATCC MYA-4620 / CBS 123657 / FGSC 9075 / NRRL 31084 / PH-1) TaxID=229533 RepID=I1RGL8_GIBZE|nr:hypothetical protein FGSG_02889 [Fusarium graminearum PH-1]ESU10416.1 hypothetical protein FGSG_02889 [Fusarium graminearum PH-1]CEF77577.1 unnamed protein product [Fusarium graminearum]|eukprot:XP_011322915.1 hypothetical protein FGSG_02889 [Fusarium graminearum PH-1]